MAGRYSREWQAHVLANLPFYELLMPRFLALTRERVSSQGDAALADVLKVTGDLTLFRYHQKGPHKVKPVRVTGSHTHRRPAGADGLQGGARAGRAAGGLLRILRCTRRAGHVPSSSGELGVTLAANLQVLTVFKAAPELGELLAGVEAGYRAFAAYPARRPCAKLLRGNGSNARRQPAGADRLQGGARAGRAASERGGGLPRVCGAPGAPPGGPAC